MSRAHVVDVVRHPTWLGDWWADLPFRRRWWWRELLLAPGEGWLRWKSDYREWISYEPPDIDQWWVYPPLHRAWLALMAWWMHPWLALSGDVGWTEWPSLQDVSCLKSDDCSSERCGARGPRLLFGAVQGSEEDHVENEERQVG